MSQPGTGRQPPPAAPAAHGDKKASGASSKSGEKKAEAAEKKPASANISQPPKTQTSGAPSAVKKQSPSADESKPQIMKPSETKSTPTTKTESGKDTQSTKPTDSQNKQTSEEMQKEPSGAKSQTSPSVTTTSKPKNKEVITTQADQPPQATSIETAKPKSEKMSVAAGAGTAGASVVAAADKSSTEPGMDESALDSLIDTLGGPEEDVPTSPVYTGPEVTEDISSRYLEEMGKREGSLPPEYVKLLKSKGDGKDGVPPKVDERDEKPMTDDELAEALSSDFTCSTASAEEKKTGLTEKPSKEGEIVQAQAASSVKTSVPPKEKKTKSKEEIKDDAVEALLDTLGGPEPEPEEDPTPVVEVSEAKAKEKKEKKAGERDDTIPPEYRLTPELDKDGKPILPKPEEKPKPLSESDLVDEFSKDFACPAQPAVQSKPSKPSSISKKPSDPVSAKTTKDEVVPRATACTVQSSAPSAVSSVGHVADEALEALSSSLGKREPDPDEKKPAVDKVKEKAKQEEHKKLGEDEETIPPEYRLTEAKDKDGKPLLPKPEEKFQPMSENDLLEGLTEGFSCSPSPSAPLPTPTVTTKTKEGEKPADSSDIISAATVSSVHSAAPLASTSGGKEMDEALDLLSDSLGEREPDPDENKPVVDKVKEKAKSEHRDKLGERDDTIPPDYQKLLESGEQGEPVKPTAKDDVKHKEQKKPTDDSAAIDALSGDFDTCTKAPAKQKHSKDKSGKETITTKPTPKGKGKPKDPKTAKGQSSSSKSEKQKTS
ncbi:calpastatin isoform X2 [Aquila chrysaetos chrysaetos]|uniref:calpastatin isoform X2 n=1 Tax=Aquila chrysaetos chrysaetos TaxID=223781 RepID=UPI001176E448|nr:calpastatin isoform X2 [Aquila chrysaetos chrysaetos]